LTVFDGANNGVDVPFAQGLLKTFLPTSAILVNDVKCTPYRTHWTGKFDSAIFSVFSSQSCMHGHWLRRLALNGWHFNFLVTRLLSGAAKMMLLALIRNMEREQKQARQSVT